MRPIGFSSGALAKGNYQRGIELQLGEDGITAIELSALREPELRPLVNVAAQLPLAHFEYVSFHAPSRFVTLREDEVANVLGSLPGQWPIVVRPISFEIRSSGEVSALVCLENMDLRKRTGRTVPEMNGMFAALPEAGFCLDLGHARQIDPTMSVAIEMLKTFGYRLRQLHVSEVGTFGEHRSRIGFLAQLAFARVARYVPADIPLILESLVSEHEMRPELETVRHLFAA